MSLQFIFRKISSAALWFTFLHNLLPLTWHSHCCFLKFESSMLRFLKKKMIWTELCIIYVRKKKSVNANRILTLFSSTHEKYFSFNSYFTAAAVLRWWINIYIYRSGFFFLDPLGIFISLFAEVFLSLCILFACTNWSTELEQCQLPTAIHQRKSNTWAWQQMTKYRW